MARLARPAGMRIWPIDVRSSEPAEQQELGLERFGGPAELEEFLAECDVLSVSLHVTPETRHYLDACLLGLLKPSAWLINVARGELIDERSCAPCYWKGRWGEPPRTCSRRSRPWRWRQEG